MGLKTMKLLSIEVGVLGVLGDFVVHREMAENEDPAGADRWWVALNAIVRESINEPTLQH